MLSRSSSTVSGSARAPIIHCDLDQAMTVDVAIPGWSISLRGDLSRVMSTVPELVEELLTGVTYDDIIAGSRSGAYLVT